jgi:lysophospholipase L1-like esterase
MPGIWPRISQTIFSQYANSTGSPLVNGWIQDGSNSFQVLNGALSVSTTNTSGYAQVYLTRPSTEACQDQRITLVQTSQSANGQVAAMVRKATAAASCYVAYLNASSGTVIDKIVSGGGSNLVTSGWSIPYVSTHVYQLDFEATGSSTTTLRWTVTDVTANQIVSVGIYVDSSSPLTSGEVGLSAWSAVGTGFTITIPTLITYSRAPIFIGFAGDSITAGTDAGSQTYPQFMQTFLNQDNPLSPVTISNQGVSGSTSANWKTGQTDYTTAVSAFSTAIAAMNPAPVQRFVQYMIGANDAKAPTPVTQATYLANITNTVNALVALGYTVVLMPPTYIVPGSDAGTWDTTAPPALQSYAAAMSTLVNGTTILAGWQGGFAFFQANQADLQDGVHPNGDQGYSILGYYSAASFQQATGNPGGGGGGSGSGGLLVVGGVGM